MNIQDSIQVVHFLPGRVRLKVAAAKSNPSYAGPVRQAIMAVPGIKSMEVNTLTGSVLIHYDSHRLLAEDGITALTCTLRAEFPGLDVDTVIRWLKTTHL